MSEFEKEYMTKRKLIVPAIVICLLTLSACGQSKVESKTSSEPAAITDDDYLRFAENSSDAFRIACHAARNHEWIFANEKWKEGNDLSEGEGKLPILGIMQALDVILKSGESAEWDGGPAVDRVLKFCSNIY